MKKYMMLLLILGIYISACGQIKEAKTTTCIKQGQSMNLFKNIINKHRITNTSQEVDSIHSRYRKNYLPKNMVNLSVFIDSNQCLHIDKEFDKTFESTFDLFDYFVSNPDKKTELPKSPKQAEFTFYLIVYSEKDTNKRLIEKLLGEIYDAFKNQGIELPDWWWLKGTPVRKINYLYLRRPSKVKTCIKQGQSMGLFEDRILRGKKSVLERIKEDTNGRFSTGAYNKLNNMVRMSIFIDSNQCLYVDRKFNKSFSNSVDLFEYYISNPDKKIELPPNPRKAEIVIYSSIHSDREKNINFVRRLGKEALMLFAYYGIDEPSEMVTDVAGPGIIIEQVAKPIYDPLEIPPGEEDDH